MVPRVNCLAIEAIEATRLPTRNPGTTRAPASRRPLIAVVRLIELGEVGCVCVIKLFIEAIEATRLPAITPGPSYFRAAAGRRPLVAVVRSIEVGEVVHVCKNAQNTARASHEKKAYSTPWYRPSTWSWEAEAGWPAGSEQDHALFRERDLRTNLACIVLVVA